MAELVESVLLSNDTTNSSWAGFWFSDLVAQYSMNNDDKTNLFNFLVSAHRKFENFQNVEFGISWPINVLGLIGNFLSLLVMSLHKQMRTPSYVYLRALSAADLIYCLNFLIEAIINNSLRFDGNKFNFRLPAYYVTFVSRFIFSTVSYMAQYMTLILGAERCIALP